MSQMQIRNKHFEQIPLETLKKILEAQCSQGESAGQILTSRENMNADFKPKVNAAYSQLRRHPCQE
jgi:hypothetical protein